MLSDEEDDADSPVSSDADADADADPTTPVRRQLPPRTARAAAVTKVVTVDNDDLLQSDPDESEYEDGDPSEN